MTTKTIKNWYLVHKWTSLVCTVFMLLLCLTGLPLIFHEEIEHLTGSHPEAAEMAEGAAPATLDEIFATGMARVPGDVPQFLVFDDHEPVVYLTTSESATNREDSRFNAYDAGTGEHIPTPPFDEGFMYVMFKLHVDLFAGLPGTLFLGVMGLLLVVAIVSGVAVYGPFMRKLDFGTVRKDKNTRVKWLDMHNMLGIVTLAWLFVVGFTGVINTLATPVFQYWQFDQLAEMVAPYKDAPPLESLSSIDEAVATARQAAPGMEPSFIAFPETDFSSKHHYAVFMRGTTPLSSRTLKPVLVDAQTGEFTASRDLPWYATALLLSQPLHFGDYGGLPLKIIWALLDIASIVVLGSGLYLWLGRRRSSLETRLRELERGADTAVPV
ncbi:PepSY domain-containing protein [Parvibaculum sp.]|uniref:PepSY-associated TM helix domain-containing protein n=1 Tax=Parvibaculum sp. TaxID=2024848 RepID=UPI0032978D16